MSHEALNDEQFEQWKNRITTGVQEHIAANRPKLDPENQARLGRAQTAARRGDPRPWRDFQEEPENVAQLLGVHPSLGGEEAPDVIRGRVAKHVFAQADIRQTSRNPEAHKPYTDPLVAAPHLVGAAEGYGESRGYPHGEVWTSQAHLHLPTLREYAQGDVPRHDPDYPGESVPYEPETYEHGGKTWLAEGHHRTVAHRLAR